MIEEAVLDRGTATSTLIPGLTFTSLSEIWKPKLIGLSGRARSGKDTVAAMLRGAFPVQTVAFADPIRDALRTMFGFTDEHFFGKLKEVEIDWLGKSPRQLMQTLGTEWGRGLVREDLWLLLAQRRVEEIMGNNFHAVVTDVRFENEAAQIRSMGGEVWHIVRDGAGAVNAHTSEAGISFHPNKDVLIDNNGTLDDLFDTVCDNF